MAEGLAQALADHLSGTCESLAVTPSPLLMRIPPAVWSVLPARLALGQAVLPAADIVIGAGRRVAPLTRALERTGAARGVQILDSGLAPRHFAAVVCPAHDGLSGENVVPTLGSVHRITPALLTQGRAAWEAQFAPLPGPRIAVLLGGATKRRAVTADGIDALAADLLRLDGSLMITASRRTGAENIARLRAALPEAWFWDGVGANPYTGMLAWADAVIVSDDSINMMSEAASTPAPVAIWPLLNESGKIAAFRETLYAKALADPFTDTLPERHTPPLAETPRAARKVAEILGWRG